MFSKFKLIFGAFTPKEKKALLIALVVFVISFASRTSLAINEHSEFVPIEGGYYREGLIGQPIALNPITSQNPIDQEVSALIYAPLKKLLVTHDIDEKRRIYSLKLKEGLLWSDGAPLTSDDVVFTIKTIQDPDALSPLFKSWQGVVVERISELQIQITIPSPYIFFESNFLGLPVIPRHAFGNIPAANLRLSSYNLEPVGSGPYAFSGLTKRRDGFIEEIELIRNKNFAGETPFMNGFAFRFYEDEESQRKAFQLRHIQGFGTLGPIDIDLKKFPQAIVESIPMPRYYAVFFNGSVNPALKKSDVRQALSLAIDKKRIASEATLDTGKPLEEPLFLDKNTDISPYDPEAAAEKLRLSKENSLEINLIVPNVDFLIKAAEIIKENWLALGIAQVNIVALNPEDLINNVVRSRNYEAVLFGNVLENKFDLFPFWHSSQRFYPGLNLSLYQNSKVDQGIERIRQDSGDINRESILSEITSQIKKDSPAAFLFSLPYTYVHTKDLGEINPGNNYIRTPADRFINVESWHLLKVRLIK